MNRIATSLFVPALLLTAALDAQGRKTGPIVLHNATTATVRLEADSIRTDSGTRDLRGTAWEIGSDRTSYLLRDGEKVPAHEFRGWLTTAEGSTYWTWTCTNLDRDGDFVMEVAPATLRAHYLELSKRPFLGVWTDADPAGARVTTVVSGSPAERAGLRIGDVIVALDGERVTDSTSLSRVVCTGKSPGTRTTVTLRRNGAEQRLAVTLAATANPLPEPVGPSNEAIGRAVAKALAGAAAWWTAKTIYDQPSDNILEQLLKEAAFELARTALDEAMASAVGDLAPRLAERDRRVLANVFVECVSGDGYAIRRADTAAAMTRLLADQGLARSDAESLAAAVSRIAGSIQQRRY